MSTLSVMEAETAYYHLVHVLAEVIKENNIDVETIQPVHKNKFTDYDESDSIVKLGNVVIYPVDPMFSKRLTSALKGE